VKKFLGVLLVVLVSALSISGVVFEATEVSVNANPETTVGGIFWENTTWTLDNSPYIITDTVQIPENVVLTIEAGVVVRPSLNSSEDFMFVVHGKIIARGTVDNKIVFDGGCVATGFSQDSASYGSSFFTTGGALSDPQLILDNCVIKNGNRFYWGTRGHLNLTNSELTNLGLTFWGYNGRSQIYYPGQDVYIQNNLFINTTGFEIANLNADVFIRYNLFTENRESLVWNTEGGGQSRTFINYNSFIDVSGTVLRLSTLGDNVILDATNNYWGTTNTGTIDSWILDGNDDIGIRGVIEYSPILTESHPDTPTLCTYTEVGGIIESDTTWMLETSPYLVTEDVVVDSGVILTIEAGVTVEFTNDTNLIIDGGLTAQGNSTHMIIFTSHSSTPAPGDWEAIRFREKSNDALCKVIWADIKYAAAGIIADKTSPTIKNCVIEYCARFGVYATSLFGLMNRGTPLIQNCTISNNGGVEHSMSFGPDREGGIYVDFGSIDVRDSSIENNNGYGILVVASSDVSVVGSTIRNNTGTGVSGDLSISYSDITENKQSGIMSSSSLHYNNIFGNVPFDFVNTGFEDVNANLNWWGTTDKATIEEQIFDFYDDYDLGKVLYEPFAQEVIPEFSSWSILPLLLTATLLVILCRRSLNSKKATTEVNGD